MDYCNPVRIHGMIINDYDYDYDWKIQAYMRG